MRGLQTQAEWCARAQWILGLSAVVILVAFYVLAYRPSTHRLETLNLQVQTKRQNLSGNRSRVQVLPEVLLAVAGTQDRLASFNKKVPRQPDIGPFITDITEIRHQAGLPNKWTIEPGVPIRGDLYREWPIALKFEGNFQSVFSFLRQAEEMQRLTRIKTLKLHSTDGGKTGQVQVELSMNIYFSEG
jgi:Tfp pilus assembly protein PilO